MSSDLKDVTEDAFAEWLEAVGGGVDVSYNGGTAVKGIVSAGTAVEQGRAHNAPKAGTVRVLADEIGTIAADGALTVDGSRVYISGYRTDAAGAITTIDYTESRPVPAELA
jgi:hypothetical protein